MLLALKEAGHFLSKHSSKIPRSNVIGLLHFLQFPIACVDGCYFLESEKTIESDWHFTPDAWFPDRTGIEWSRNKIHVLRHLGGDRKFASKPGVHNLLLGLVIADILRMKLVCAYPAVRFRISVSWHVKGTGDPELDRLNVRRDCCVSFHAERPDEVFLEDLEGFELEAVGVLLAGPSTDRGGGFPGFESPEHEEEGRY